jgi:hypothetical protein
MSRDRRGFTYALEPVRSMTAWDIDRIALELAEHNAAVSTQQSRFDQLCARLADARARVIAQRESQALLDIDAQRNAHGFMRQLQLLLLKAQAELLTAQQTRDATLERLVQARKFADSLDRNKETAAAEHDARVAKATYQEADDNWLQRQHGRQQP